MNKESNKHQIQYKQTITHTCVIDIRIKTVKKKRLTFTCIHTKTFWLVNQTFTSSVAAVYWCRNDHHGSSGSSKIVVYIYTAVQLCVSGVFCSRETAFQSYLVVISHVHALHLYNQLNRCVMGKRRVCGQGTTSGHGISLNNSSLSNYILPGAHRIIWRFTLRRRLVMSRSVTISINVTRLISNQINLYCISYLSKGKIHNY